MRTAELGALEADFYIDCTGQRALLIGEALGSKLRPLHHVLLADRALAVQLPYARPDAPIASYTIATAQEAGWTWDIGLQERRSVGYVYSSRHTSERRAETVLRAHVGAGVGELAVRQLKQPAGCRDVQWKRNCVAVGAASGFIEPLEASGIGLIETAAALVGCLFPFDGNLEPAAKRFNAVMKQRYERAVDFVKMHYCLTQRRDSAFWIDNADAATIPTTLQERLSQWRCRAPHRLDFSTDVEMYPPSSWQYVLYGMEFKTELGLARGALTRDADARQEFAMLQQVSERALADLPDHRAYVTRLSARAGASAAAAPR